GFLPPREASEALAQAGAIVLPFRDGASLRSGSLLAALRTGRPVVTTAPRSVGDLGELMELPQLIAAPASDPAELRAVIARALAWSGTPATLPGRFRWQSIATEHRALYQRLLDERVS
ncbi:MAG: hypothetical protein WEC79_08380, partial [Thermomicrobiales bacterium]